MNERRTEGQKEGRKERINGQMKKRIQRLMEGTQN